jgi:hypothetical protein
MELLLFTLIGVRLEFWDFEQKATSIELRSLNQIIGLDYVMSPIIKVDLSKY